METTTRLLLPEVKDALHSDPESLVELTEELHPADLADLVEALDPDDARQMLAILPVEVAADVLEHCEDAQQVELFAQLADARLGTAVAIVDAMVSDDRADLIAELADDLRSKLLANVDDEESRDIRQLMAYPEDSAGSLMTTDYVALPASTAASDAIDMVRQDAEEMETIYQAYAVDINGTLLGVVSLRDLVTSPADKSIDAVMNPNVVSVPAEADQEEVARLIAKYDLLALPVVDRNHRILGIITVDDVIDVLQEEATEDIHSLGAVDPLEDRYIDTPMWDLVKARAPWLIVLFVAVYGTKEVLAHYSESNIESLAMLMWFVPLVISVGGNSGSQSATLIIRAFAVGGLEMNHAGRVLMRELVVGLKLGVIVGLAGVGAVLLDAETRNLAMVLTMSLSVVAIVTVGGLLGSGVPMILRRLGIDPAVASTPFIASMVDVAGLVIYFEIAKALLP
ncbi:MAG: magnesium transporter [Deltaproteobacteria bacterium]|nr:magnesium transporter [Deltaproteobacteria bacterium]